MTAVPAAAQSWEDVALIFGERCVLCHSGEFAPLGLSLDSHKGVMAGSENGSVVDPTTPGASALLQRITGVAEPRMPLDGPPFLSETEIDVIAAWIASDATGPNVEEPRAEVAETAPTAPQDPYADGQITYGEVEVIFKQRCIECHSDNSKMVAPPEGLRLTSLAEILAGGERLAVIPGNPLASELIRRVEGLSDPRMPLDGPPWLTEAQITLLRNWIAGGALNDELAAAPIPVGGKVRFRGIMTAPDAIDSARFVITSGTRIDDRPMIGSAAEMRGRIAADGSILAERLRDR